MLSISLSPSAFMQFSKWDVTIERRLSLCVCVFELACVSIKRRGAIVYKRLRERACLEGRGFNRAILLRCLCVFVFNQSFSGELTLEH